MGFVGDLDCDMYATRLCINSILYVLLSSFLHLEIKVLFKEIHFGIRN